VILPVYSVEKTNRKRGKLQNAKIATRPNEHRAPAQQTQTECEKEKTFVGISG
jgi:hypothetical protein